jgi:heme oxygenase (mycobilin-producing)
MITLINAFEITQVGKEDEFIQLWNETADLMKKEPGFIDTKLHRSLDPKARFQFVNIAHWESPETWQQIQVFKTGGKKSQLSLKRIRHFTM